MGAKGAAAMQVKTGGVAVAPPPSSDCVALGNKNTAARSALGQKSRDQSVVGLLVSGKKSGRGTTVSSCKMSSGRPSMRVAHNNQKAYEKCPNLLTQGGSSQVREGSSPSTCGYAHPSPAMQKSGHAEARLLDSMAGGALPKSITFNIDWRRRVGPASKMPCSTCHKYMCRVQQECKVEILLCDKNGAKHKLPCPATRATRTELRRKLNGK